jgi:hypothetical protein
MKCTSRPWSPGTVMRSIALLFLATVAFGFAAMPARAGGTVTIQHSDGTIDTYRDAAIKVIHSALYVTSADGKGTMVINRAACSYQGDTYVCLPTSVTLVQSGSTNAVDLSSGTIYANMTDDAQQLPLSSQHLGPHSILLSITTKKGTTINLSGTIDKVTK